MGPRIFGIPARDADVVAIIRRGPSGWCHVGRWEPDSGLFESGSWLHGTIYPQRCDVSPDGRWFVMFALKSGARWRVGDTYLSVSRLPWLTSLAAWSTGGTWTRGLQFVPRHGAPPIEPPDSGDIGPLRRRYGLAGTPPGTFAVERRNGWSETASTPERSAADPWDERRADRVVMEKPRPGDAATLLCVSGWYAAFRTMGPAWGRPSYGIAGTALEQRPLDDVQWAEWSRSGRLLVATDDGRIGVREAPFTATSTVWEQDLASLRPDPQPPPPQARRW